jgi:hypothetical protein
MAAVQAPARVSPGESVEQQFYRLKTEWRQGTLVFSDPGKIMSHPAMRAIIAMGDLVVPIILRDLQAETTLLVWALPEITGIDLAPPQIEDGFAKWDISAQIEAWLNWGRKRGLV